MSDTTDWQAIAAEQGTKIIRLVTALKIIREFGGLGRGFNGNVMAPILAWMDGDLNEPVPWPRSPFFAKWADSQGMSNIDGCVGYMVTLRSQRDKLLQTYTGSENL